MSDPTPPADPAPTTAPAVEAPPPAPPPSIEALVNDETADLTSTGLPEQTIAEIKKLRKDAKDHREYATSWREATAGWSDADMDMLRQVLSVAQDDPVAVGEWMQQQGAALLGTTGDDTMPIDDIDDTDDMLTKESVAEIVAKAVADALKGRDEQSQQAEFLAQIRKESADAGFGPDHKLHKALLLIAKDDTDGDIAAAAELLRKEIAGGTSQEPPAEAERTPVPPEGVAPSGSRPVATTAKQAAMERLDKALAAAAANAPAPD